MKKGTFVESTPAEGRHGDFSTKWLWNEWLARGHTYLLDGPSNSGRECVAAAIVAAATGRVFWPDGSLTEPGHVLIYDSSGFYKEFLPLVEAAGADMRFVDVYQNLGALELRGAALVVVSPHAEGLFSIADSKMFDDETGTIVWPNTDDPGPTVLGFWSWYGRYKFGKTRQTAHTFTFGATPLVTLQSSLGDGELKLYKNPPVHPKDKTLNYQLGMKTLMGHQVPCVARWRIWL